MANPNEDSLNAPDPNANVVSKVGSSSVITVQESMTIISEIIQSFMQKSSVEPTNMWLPRFNPEVWGADPAAWCASCNRLMGENPLQGSALFSALSRALEGSAAEWLQKIVVDETITWPRFKELFTMRFGGNENATLALMKIMKERPLEGETTGAFGIRLHSFLKSRWENLTMTEIINAAVLFRLATEHQHVKHLSLTKNIKTKEEFISEMRLLSCTEKWLEPWTDNLSAGPAAKRRKRSKSVKCFYCGVPGHKVAVCRKRRKFEKQRKIRNQEGNRPTTPLKDDCYFECHEEDHDASDCPLLQKNYNSNEECPVDSCVVDTSTDKLSIIDTSEDE